jgi:DNA replication protein DnaC
MSAVGANPTDPTHAAVIEGYLRAFKMPGALRVYLPLAEEAKTQGHSYLAYLADLLTREAENRRANQMAQRLRQAKLPTAKTLDTFDFAAVRSLNRPRILNLSQGDFLRAHENVILLGPSGLGKTHLGAGICQALIYQGFRTRFTTAARLMEELAAAQRRGELQKTLRSWARYDLVMVDEIGYVPFTPDGARVMFQFFAEAYERQSLLVTSNLTFARWVDVFGDPTMTAALLDRLTHRAHIFTLDGESYRLRQAKQQRSSASAP